MSLLYTIFIIAYFLYVGIWNDFNNVLIKIPTNIFMFCPLVFAGRLLGMFHTLYLNFASFCFYDKSWIFDMVIYNYVYTFQQSIYHFVISLSVLTSDCRPPHLSVIRSSCFSIPQTNPSP